MSDSGKTLTPTGGANEIDPTEIRPFPGLRPFHEDETHLYFGREEHRRELLKRLVATRFVAVVGTSGSGKSSLLGAGLLPDLYSGYLPRTGSDWIVVSVRPGNDPIGRLASGFCHVGWIVSDEELRTNSNLIQELAGENLAPDQHLLVLVDQFEELFRLQAREHPVADRDEKASFVRLLLEAGGQTPEAAFRDTQRVHVVIAMRSEFLGRASKYRGLPEAIGQGQYLIPRLSREQLRRAIECPVAVADGRIEEALVQRLLNELGDDQDQLPVLQHALMRTWECWRGQGSAGALDDSCYLASGGFSDALSRDASEALEETRRAMGADGERIVKRVFQALRETDVNGGQTRRPTTIADLNEIADCDSAHLATALASFRSRSFLVPPPNEPLTDSSLIDVSHEALLRRWTTLKGWIEEDEADRRLYLRIANRAMDEGGSQNPQYFAKPLLPVLARFWDDRTPPRLWAVRHHTGYEQARDFLNASLRHQKSLDDEAERERVRATEEEARQTRAKERKWLALMFGATAVVVVVAFLMYYRSQSQRLDTLNQHLETLVIETKAANAEPSQFGTRLQLTAEVFKRQPTIDVQYRLLQSIFDAAKPLREIDVASETRVALSSDGNVVFTANTEGRLRAVTIATGVELFNVGLPESETIPSERPVPLPLPAPRGRKLVVLSDVVSVLDAATGRFLYSPKVPGLRAGAISEDGVTAAFVGQEGIYRCNLSKDCRVLERRALPERWAYAVDLSLSPTADKLAVVGALKEGGSAVVALFDTKRWKTLESMEPEPDVDDLRAIALDKEYLRLCWRDRITFLDVYDDSLDESLDAPVQPDVSRCAASPSQIATSHEDGTIRVWDDEGTQVALAPGGASGAVDVALAGMTLGAAGERLRLWDLTRFGHSPADPAASMFFGRSLYRVSGGRLIDVASKEAMALSPHVAPDSWSLLFVSESLHALFVNQRTRTLEYTQLSKTGPPVARWKTSAKGGTIPDGSPSPDGRFVAVRYRSTTGRALFSLERSADEGFTHLLAILDAKSGREVRMIGPSKGLSYAFVPNRDEVLLRASGRLELWPIPSGEPREIPGKDPRLKSGQIGVFAFSPDANYLAVAELPIRAAPGDASSGKSTLAVRVWEWPALTLRHEFQHSDWVALLAFRSDSKALLTATASSVHAWDLEKGEEIARIPASSRVFSLAFTPSGSAAFRDSFGLSVLPLSPETWVKEACSRIWQNLSEREWRDLLGPDIRYKKTCSDRP